MPSATPTRQTYDQLQLAYDFFNDELFESQLPACLISLQRKKGTAGYFSGSRFANAQGQIVDEIALNPELFGIQPLREVMQTLVHEMTHLWQHHFGQPSRRGYHNAEWADKMESVGLMPTSTGKAGGARTGDRIADMAIDDGAFSRSKSRLVTEKFELTWFDRTLPAVRLARVMQEMGLTPQRVLDMIDAGEDVSDLIAAVSPAEARLPIAALREFVRCMAAEGWLTGEPRQDRSNRVKYACRCKNAVWGRSGLTLQCLSCAEQMLPTEGKPR